MKYHIHNQPVICILKIKSVMSYDSELLKKGIKNTPTILSYEYFNMCFKNDFKSFNILRLEFILGGQNLVKFVKKFPPLNPPPGALPLDPLRVAPQTPAYPTLACNAELPRACSPHQR